MYKVGDKVLYPMHGAGLIEGIEEREIMGEKHSYYTMHIPVGDMKVMIPCNGTEKSGLRDIINEETADKALEFLKEEVFEENCSWNKRYRENLIKIKSGDIFEVALVLKTLLIREKEKGLSTGERKMLSDARHIFVSELVLVKNVEKEELLTIIETNVFSEM